MKLRARILRMTTETGPRSMNVLRGINHHAEDFDGVVKAMREAGELVKYGKKRDAKWGAPGWVKPKRRKFE